MGSLTIVLQTQGRIAGKVFLQNSCGYLMLQIVMNILVAVFLFA
jgi:hypothetical protein